MIVVRRQRLVVPCVTIRIRRSTMRQMVILTCIYVVAVQIIIIHSEYWTRYDCARHRSNLTMQDMRVAARRRITLEEVRARPRFWYVSSHN